MPGNDALCIVSGESSPSDASPFLAAEILSRARRQQILYSSVDGDSVENIFSSLISNIKLKAEIK